MSLTWGQVKRWSAAPFTTAEEALTTSRRDLLDRADDLRTMAGPARWVGSAATTAQHRLTRVTDDLEILVAEVSAARRAVIEAGDAVTGVELAVDAAAEYAGQYGLEISADGTVTDEPGCWPATPPSTTRRSPARSARCTSTSASPGSSRRCARPTTSTPTSSPC